MHVISTILQGQSPERNPMLDVTGKSVDGMDLEAYANHMAGNHRKFTDFGWHERPSDDELWCIVYTHNRDSGLLDESNAAQIESALKRYERRGTVRSERHSHWAVGWVDGYAIRVYTHKGKITKAFKTYFSLMSDLEDYPVLDEEDYSRREYEETIENIENEGSRYVKEGAPDGWSHDVYAWLWDNEPCEVENVDDNGGYPSSDAIKRALYNVDLLDPDYLEDIEDVERDEEGEPIEKKIDHPNQTYINFE